jgi:ABC-type lipoprotein export system ATPase subunit
LRIHSLTIRNLRAIEHFEVTSLGPFVLIAGPNGCGKTTVLDAIRILKSVYSADEWKRWFNEFGINVDRPTNWSTLFRDPSQPIAIHATLVLAEHERAFLRERAANIALALELNATSERKATITGDPPLEPPATTPQRAQAVRRKAEAFERRLTEALASGSEFVAGVQLTAAPSITVDDSPIALGAFSCFNPEELGEVEFHTSRRLYARESVSSIRLNVGDRSEERRSRFLYDLENKYRNIKTQLGEEYVASILRRADPDEAPLQKSIKELFRTFFPGKEFAGVSLGPGNTLAFPIRLSTGETHDIDELSSGEKEIVYGYLWLRTGTPRGSIILVDEPELHLNPALVQGLPAFYKAHLADALGAQVWIVTHSDGILRQAVRSPDMAVYHMARAAGDGSQQAVHIDSQDAVEAAVLDLIGDLAAYRPYAKIVLMEGHKETRFDVEVVRRLFPELAERANFIPVGSRQTTSGVRVRLLEVLSETGLTGRAVSITDGDLGLGEGQSDAGQFTWPAYEIENFLLDTRVLRGALAVLLGRDPYDSDGALMDDLRHIARGIVAELAVDEVQYVLNRQCVRAIAIGAGRNRPVENLAASAAASQGRVRDLDFSHERVRQLFREAEEKLVSQLRSAEFLVRFPGDRLIRALAGRHSLNGDHFRNACLDQAQRQALRPTGMHQTLMAALA